MQPICTCVILDNRDTHCQVQNSLHIKDVRATSEFLFHSQKRIENNNGCHLLLCLECSDLNGYVQIFRLDLRTRKKRQICTAGRILKQKMKTSNDLDGPDEFYVKKLDKLEIAKITLVICRKICRNPQSDGKPNLYHQIAGSPVALCPRIQIYFIRLQILRLQCAPHMYFMGNRHQMLMKTQIQIMI